MTKSDNANIRGNSGTNSAHIRGNQADSANISGSTTMARPESRSTVGLKVASAVATTAKVAAYGTALALVATAAIGGGGLAIGAATGAFAGGYAVAAACYAVIGRAAKAIETQCDKAIDNREAYNKSEEVAWRNELGEAGIAASGVNYQEQPKKDDKFKPSHTPTAEDAWSQGIDGGRGL